MKKVLHLLLLLSLIHFHGFAKTIQPVDSPDFNTNIPEVTGVFYPLLHYDTPIPTSLELDSKIEVYAMGYLCLWHKSGGLVEIFGNAQTKSYSVRELLQQLEKKQKQLKRKKVSCLIGTIVNESYFYGKNSFWELPKYNPNRCPAPPILILLPSESYLIEPELDVAWINTKENYYSNSFKVAVTDLSEESFFETETTNTSTRINLTDLETEEDMLIFDVKYQDIEESENECTPHTFLVPTPKELLDKYAKLKAKLGDNIVHHIREINFLAQHKCGANAHSKWLNILEEYPENHGLRIAYMRFLIQHGFIGYDYFTNHKEILLATVAQM